MGWFDDTEVFVDVIATKLTDNTASPIKNAVVSSTVRDSGVTDGILAGMINGLGARAGRFYRYAEKNHPDGLPTAEIGIEGNGTYESEYEPFPGTFYPIVNIRKDKQFLTKESDEEKHKVTKRMLKRVALNLDNVIANLEDQERLDEDGNVIEGNPVADLDDVFFLFGIDIFSTDEHSAIYMHDFWESIKDSVKIDANQHEFYKQEHDEDGDVAKPQGVPSNSIKLGEEAGDFETKILFDYMFKTDHAGELTDDEGKKVKGKITTNPGGLEQFPMNNAEGTPRSIIYVDTSFIEYAKKTDSGYSVWTVYGLQHITNVLAYEEKHQVVRSLIDIPPTETNEGVEGIYVKYADRKVGDPNWGRSGFYFPVCKEVLELQHTAQEEIVLVDAMTLIMHAAQEVELEWYQQKWFKIVMVIIVAAIIYFSLGAAFKEGITFMSLMNLALQVGISFIVDLLIKHVDGDLAILLAVVASAYAASKGNFASANNILPHAKELLMATKVVTEVANAKVKKDTSELQEEILELEKTVKEHDEEIRAAYNMLPEPGVDIDPFDIIQGGLNTMPFDESPSDFYNRAKTTNVAPLVKEAISTYHSRMKELPRVPEDDSFATA